MTLCICGCSTSRSPTEPAPAPSSWSFDQDLVQFLTLSVEAEPQEGSFRVQLANELEFAPKGPRWEARSRVLAVSELVAFGVPRQALEDKRDVLRSATLTTEVGSDGARITVDPREQALHDALGPGLHSVVGALGVPPLPSPEQTTVRSGPGVQVLDASEHREDSFDDEGVLVEVEQNDHWSIEMLAFPSRPVHARLESTGSITAGDEVMSHKVVLESHYLPKTPRTCVVDIEADEQLDAAGHRWFRSIVNHTSLARSGPWVWRATLAGDALSEASAELDSRAREVGRASRPCDVQQRLLYLASGFIALFPHASIMKRISAVVPPDAVSWSAFPVVASQLAGDVELADPSYSAKLRRHEDVVVRQWATAGALRRAAVDGDHAAQLRLWEELRQMDPEEPSLAGLVRAMSPQRPLATGSPIPKVALADFDGRAMALEPTRPQLIVGWATWCKSCMEELPSFVALAEDHPDLMVIGINMDTDVESAQTELSGRAFPSNWVHVRSPDVEALMSTWGVTALPFHVLTGDTGRVVVGPPFDEIARIRRRLEDPPSGPRALLSTDQVPLVGPTALSPQ